jgi:protein-tyrosine-phosphatase
LKKKRPSWEVRSAGVAAIAGSQASEKACLVAAEEGLDLSGHRARAIETVCVRDFDRIYTMSERHLEGLPNGSGALLSSIVGESVPIKDPYGGSLSAYRRAFREIREYLRALLSQQEGS